MRITHPLGSRAVRLDVPDATILSPNHTGTFLLLRRASRPNAPRPIPKSGKAAGNGVTVAITNGEVVVATVRVPLFVVPALMSGSRRPLPMWVGAQQGAPPVPVVGSQPGQEAQKSRAIAKGGRPTARCAYRCGNGEHARRNRGAKSLGGFEIDHQLELGGPTVKSPGFSRVVPRIVLKASTA